MQPGKLLLNMKLLLLLLQLMLLQLLLLLLRIADKKGKLCKQLQSSTGKTV